MELKDLKKAWDQYSSADKKNELDVETIREMLRGRTKSLIDKIERNIKIGFIVLFVLIVLFIIDDFVLSPELVKSISAGIEIPGWIVPMDLITNLFIIVTFIGFVYRYYQVRKKCDLGCALTGALTKIIHILNIYKRMFYFAILVLVLSTATGFIAGLYEGVLFSAQQSGITVNEIKTGNIVITILAGLVVLFLLTGALFLLFRWGFRRLYGNYHNKLKLTLKELNEIE